MDLDSTVALLSSNLPVGGDPNSAKKKKVSKKAAKEVVEEPSANLPLEVEPFVDSEEDEIFFGEKSDKELHGKNSKFTRRKTLHLGMGFPKLNRSLDVASARPKDNQMWTQYRNQREESIAESIDEDTKYSTALNDLSDEETENIDPKNDQSLESSSKEKSIKEETKTTPQKQKQPEKSNSAITMDNLQISKDVTTVIPSPRKINMEKIEPCERKYRSRSPIKDLNQLSPSNIKTPPRRILHSREDDADTSKENSILDVGNDQMFDDSIFTEYDDKNLSCMSTNMTKKWRKKWEKEDLRKKTFGTETIDRLVAKQESLLQEELENLSAVENNQCSQEKKETIVEKELEVDLQNISTCSQWFNTTHDEMILFEKFGEDYDEIVNQMSHEEKLKLKQEVDKKFTTTEEETSEILEQSEKNTSILPDVIPASPDMIPPSPPIPKPRTRTPVKPALEKNRQIVHGGTTDAFLKPNNNPTLSGKYFKSTMGQKSSPNYLRPTTASKMRMSPRKKDVYFSNPGAQSNEPEACPRAGCVQPVDFVPKNKLLKGGMSGNLTPGKVVSPVGQYIRSNPVPPIVRQIRPKATKHFDDDLAAFERDEELCNKQPILPMTMEGNKRQFKPLPMAEYKSSKVALEQKMPSATDEIKSLPKVFGIAPSVEAKIIRHLGREKVPKNTDFSKNSSPLAFNPPASREGGKIFKSPHSLQKSRESEIREQLDETNTMEISIRQVVEVKKMTSNRP